MVKVFYFLLNHNRQIATITIIIHYPTFRKELNIFLSWINSRQPKYVRLTINVIVEEEGMIQCVYNIYVSMWSRWAYFQTFHGEERRKGGFEDPNWDLLCFSSLDKWLLYPWVRNQPLVFMTNYLI